METKNTETKKQEAIRLAYGEYWGYVKNFVDENGWYNWFESKTNINIDNLEFETSKNGFKLRAKSLQGIENNNGWISIESEEDLPKESGQFWIVENGKIYYVFSIFSNKKVIFSGDMSKATHYQPIQKPKKQIF